MGSPICNKSEALTVGLLRTANSHSQVRRASITVTGVVVRAICASVLHCRGRAWVERLAAKN
jgi:hypothetical protein